jgi:hypothetical protein
MIRKRTTVPVGNIEGTLLSDFRIEAWKTLVGFPISIGSFSLQFSGRGIR